MRYNYKRGALSKMPRRKRNYGWVKWLVFLILIAGVVTVVILVKNNIFGSKPKEEKESSSSVIEQKEEKLETKTDEKADEKTDEPQKSDEKVPQYEGETPNKSEVLTGLITYANVMNDKLVIRVSVDQFLQSGNCDLVFSRNGVTYYSQSVGIVESVTTSTCDGFEIPVGELPTGDIQVEINLNSQGKTGRIEGRVKI